MKKTNRLIISMTLLPWLTVPFLGAKSLRRFLPSSIFMSLFLIAEARFAEKKKWWWFPFNLKPNVLGEIPLIIGPFFVGTIWIMKYTFGKFNTYFLTNLIIDSIFTYFGIDLLKKLGYVTLVRLSKIQLSIVFLIKTFLLYGFQIIYEKNISKLSSS